MSAEAGCEVDAEAALDVTGCKRSNDGVDTLRFVLKFNASSVVVSLGCEIFATVVDALADDVEGKPPNNEDNIAAC